MMNVNEANYALAVEYHTGMRVYVFKKIKGSV